MTFHAKTATAGELLWFNGSVVNIMVSGSQGEDGITVMEHRMPYGDSPPLHIHRNEDEVFHILEGTMRFRLEGRDLIAHAGQTVMAPKGIAHTYRVESKPGARCLVMTTGGDFERMVREVSVPAQSADLPPHMEPTPEMMSALLETCRRNGIDIIGAPLS